MLLLMLLIYNSSVIQGGRAVYDSSVHHTLGDQVLGFGVFITRGGWHTVGGVVYTVPSVNKWVVV